MWIKTGLTPSTPPHTPSTPPLSDDIMQGNIFDVIKNNNIPRKKEENDFGILDELDMS